MSDYEGIFADLLAEFVAFKRSMGFKYVSETYQLRLIAHGIEKQGKLPQDIDSTRSRTQSCHRPLGAPRVNQFGREDRSL